MADKNIGLLVAKLNIAIKSGVDLFNEYKELSKEFQEQQQILTNNRELKKESANLIQKYGEEMKFINAKRKGTKNLISTLPAHVIERQLKKEDNAEIALKNKYEKNLGLINKKSKISEIYLVNSDKKFLKEKKKITDRKKIILKNILEIGKEIRSKMDTEEFKKFVNKTLKLRFKVFNGKIISFDTLMHHLSSGEVSDEVSKTTKQIDELMTIGNVINRKKRMEIGIKQKEIEKLVKNYEKTEKLSKELVKKEITKLVKSLNGISNAKEKEAVTTKIDRLSRSLKNEMTERERKIKYDIQIKTQELKELEKSL